MEKEKFQRFSVSLPEDLLNDFDIIREKIGMSRSDAIRKAMRNFIIDYNWARSENRVQVKAGTISIIFDHTQRIGMMDELNDIQHKYMDIIDAAMHIHLDKKDCMLILAVKGDSVSINNFLKELNAKPEYRQVKQILLEIEAKNSDIASEDHTHSHSHSI